MKEERSNININIGIERSFIVDERREEVLLKFKFYFNYFYFTNNRSIVYILHSIKRGRKKERKKEKKERKERKKERKKEETSFPSFFPEKPCIIKDICL